MRDTVYVTVFDGFADHEIALALTEIRRPGDFRIVTVAVSDTPVTAMSGLCVQPDVSLQQVELQRTALLIAPGGHRWERGNEGFVALMGDVFAAGAPVAATAGGILGLARAGLLERRRHTSNAAGYIELFVPGYAGRDQYDGTVAAVSDEGVISASGVAAVEFAGEVIRTLDLYDAEDAAHWYRLFKHAASPPWLAPALVS